MIVTQTGYRTGQGKKNRHIVCRVTEKEFKLIKQLADTYTGGNLSDLIRLVFLKQGGKIGEDKDSNK